MTCVRDRKILATIGAISSLVLSLSLGGRASAETFEVELPELVGGYSFGVERTSQIHLGFRLFEIQSVVVRWSGSITTGELACWDDGPRGTGGEFEASFAPEAQVYGYHSETSDEIGVQIPFSSTDDFTPQAGTTFSFLLDGTATLHVSFLLGRSIPECSFVSPYATGSLDSATLVIVGRRMRDYDGDGDVDLYDFTHFQECFNGPNTAPLGTDCGDMDSDGDGDVDLSDFTVFQACFNGPNQPPRCP